MVPVLDSSFFMIYYLTDSYTFIECYLQVSHIAIYNFSTIHSSLVSRLICSVRMSSIKALSLSVSVL